MKTIEIRNRLNESAYSAIKNVLFHIEPEKAHNLFLNIGKSLNSHNLTKRAVSKLFNYQHHSLEQKYLGIKFKNPIGKLIIKTCRYFEGGKLGNYC